jgi:hypothetical protein
MNFKIVIFLLFAVSIPTFLSACTSVNSKEAEEVVFDSKTGGSSNEIYITNADVKEQDQVTTSNLRKGGQLEKRLLSDASVIETLVDGFGNKVETRYFKGHPRVRMLILRTSVNGNQQVTVYGHSDTKFVPELRDRALTASGDEIASVAQLYTTPSSSGAVNFMKKRKTQTTLQPLQPLPSSSFQKPVAPVVQQVEPVQQETTSTEKTVVPQKQSKDEED